MSSLPTVWLAELISVVDPACEVVAPGVIEHHRYKRFTIGEPDGTQGPRNQDETRRASSIVQKITTVPQRTPSLHGDITGDLLHPKLIRVNRESSNVHPAALEIAEKQHVAGHQTAQREHVCGEEVGSRQQRQVGSNED
jgi:hypothetical protein